MNPLWLAPYLIIGKLWRRYLRFLDYRILFPQIKKVAVEKDALMDSQYPEVAIFYHLTHDHAWTIDYTEAELITLTNDIAANMRKSKA